MTTINLQPTDAGYARIRDSFRESVASHQHNIVLIEQMLEDEKFLDGYTEQQIELVTEALTMLLADKQHSVALLNEQIQDIGAYLRSKRTTGPSGLLEEF